MAICAAGHQVRDGSAFCQMCGAPVVVQSQLRTNVAALPTGLCGSCGGSNPPGSAFCMNCGASIQPAAAWATPMAGGMYAPPTRKLVKAPSPLVSILVLLNALAMFAMLGFLGVYVGQRYFGEYSYQGPWTFDGHFFQFWNFFNHGGGSLMIWRIRATVIDVFVSLIVGICLVSGRSIRASVAPWIVLLVITSITAILNIVSVSVSIFNYSDYSISGVTGPSVTELVLVLGLFALSIIGIVQARRAKKRM